MKVDELIERLQAIKDHYGNIEITHSQVNKEGNPVLEKRFEIHSTEIVCEITVTGSLKPTQISLVANIY